MENNSHAGAAASSRPAVQRHSILDLAPLELDCMNVLWTIGQGTVRDIHQHLAKSRPRAYTTVLTIMDRLAQKGIAIRHKVGRAFMYQPKLSAEEARQKAVDKIVDRFFDGSPEALAAHLTVRHKASLASRACESGPHGERATATAEMIRQNRNKAYIK